jgi:hypothetical protein
MLHEVWREGFRATGSEGTAVKIGEVEAESFAEACDKLCSLASWQIWGGTYDRGTVWGCRLFNNEADARRSFGLTSELSGRRRHPGGCPP